MELTIKGAVACDECGVFLKEDKAQKVETESDNTFTFSSEKAIYKNYYCDRHIKPYDKIKQTGMPYTGTTRYYKVTDEEIIAVYEKGKKQK